MTRDEKRAYQMRWISDRKNQYLKGKCCYFCGTKENIEVHHVDPNEKESHKIWSWKHERIIKELKKCIYICRSCHSKFHTIIKRVPLVHGTLNGYDKYKCRCTLCKAKKEYHRNRKKYDAMGFKSLVEKFNSTYGVDESFIERMVA